MIGTVLTFGINGITAEAVSCECFVTNGLPAFEIVGLPDTSIKEARERVRAAIKSSGIPFPNSRITVNLSPANLKKSGGHYDLPILVGLLMAVGSVPRCDESFAFVGEVSLEGKVRSVPGVLSMALAAKKKGVRRLYVPADNAAEATIAQGANVIPVRTVEELVADLRNERRIAPQAPYVLSGSGSYDVDYKDVVGQDDAKRSMLIAAAGGHNVLLIGPPGSGKSMISKRIPTILPDLTREESLEVSQIYSVLGLLNPSKPLITERPFRSPHHTVSNAGLVGGGTFPKPGEISMAHKGVLFLDEFPEFHKDTLELLRQPLEDGNITISRSNGSVTYPAQSILVCAMNPCPCGWHGYGGRRCKCTPKAIERYVSKISGPLLDRIDMIVEVPPVSYKEMKDRRETESSASMKRKVDRALEIQFKRFGNGYMRNGHMGPEAIREFCVMDPSAEGLMKSVFEELNLSARGHDRLLKLARTVADMRNSERIGFEHLAEAISMRTKTIGEV